MKILLLSDTHGQKVKNLPKADLLIHSGDWSGAGTYKETRDLIEWLQTIKHKFGKIVVVPGNHDRWVEANQAQAKREFADNDMELLIHESTFHMGAIIYGHPMTPIFGNWAFMGNDRQRKLAADAIPLDTSILVSHGPPLGYLDKLAENGSAPGMSVGCKHLAEAVLRVQPEMHVFGHIHEGSGVMTLGKTLLVNASHMDEYYTPTNAFKVVYL
jgi:Icc-related predicted phosphoesterase